MRQKLVRGLVAATLAATLAAGVAVGPAHAGRAANQVQFFNWAALAVGVARAVFSGGGPSSGELQAAVHQIRSAVDAARTDIINHIDAIASAEVRACARQHTIEFTDIDNFPPSVRILWAQSATHCAALATEFLRAVQSPAAADNIGRVIGEIHTIAMAARAKANLGPDGIRALLNQYILATETIIIKLAPGCTESTAFHWPMVQVTYVCRAYNGDSAQGVEHHLPGRPSNNPINRTEVENTATRNTSRAVAQTELPTLRTV